MTKKINLLFLCNSPQVPAGVEKTAIILGEGLETERFNIRFILNGDGPFAEELRDTNADIEIIESNNRYSGNWHHQLNESLINRPADIVQLHLSRLNARLLHKHKTKVVERLNMTRHSSFRYPLQWKWLDNLTATWIDQFIVVSESLKQDFIHRGYDAPRLKVIYNGINVPDPIIPADLKEELGIPKDHLIIGTMGRLTAQKGVETFLEMASDIAKEINNIHFIIAGDGELRLELEKQAKLLYLNERVHFTGFRNDGLNVIAAFDMLIYLSRWEPFANTIIEGLAVGTPIVATNVGGNKEAIKNDYNGLLVPPDNPKSATECVKKLLSDTKFRDELINNGKNSISSFTVDNMVDEHSQLYEDLCSRQKSS